MNIIIALAALLSGFQVPAAAAPEWEWRGTEPTLDIDLARANIRIAIRQGASKVRISTSGADASAVTFAAVSAGGTVRIRDHYPSRGQWMPDCLPPVGDRGDFWTYSVPLAVTIDVPPGTRLRVRAMRGNIRVEGKSVGFDLATGDGVVQHPAA